MDNRTPLGPPRAFGPGHGVGSETGGCDRAPGTRDVPHHDRLAPAEPVIVEVVHAGAHPQVLDDARAQVFDDARLHVSDDARAQVFDDARLHVSDDAPHDENIQRALADSHGSGGSPLSWPEPPPSPETPEWARRMWHHSPPDAFADEMRIERLHWAAPDLYSQEERDRREAEETARELES
eukprot:7057460-Alexandrium_andersonii.AAC.1